jgi:hypothetical protein
MKLLVEIEIIPLFPQATEALKRAGIIPYVMAARYDVMAKLRQGPDLA